MATDMWLISYDAISYENRLASFCATLIGLVNLPLVRLFSIFFANQFIYHHGMDP